MSINTDLFDGIVEDVITLTARPDQDAETKLAVRTATNNAHFCDAFPRDMQTMQVQLPVPSYSSQLDIPTLFPKLRGIDTIRILGDNYLPFGGDSRTDIEVIELGALYDDYGMMRRDVAYLAGDKLNILSSLAAHGFIVSWFKAPQTGREQYNSWIAQLYPDIIVYWAAAIVLSTNGNEEKAARYMQMVQTQFMPFLKSNFLLGAMR